MAVTDLGILATLIGATITPIVGTIVWVVRSQFAALRDQGATLAELDRALAAHLATEEEQGRARIEVSRAQVATLQGVQASLARQSQRLETLIEQNAAELRILREICDALPPTQGAPANGLHTAA